MRLSIWYAQYKESHSIKSLDEIPPIFLQFVDKYQLTEKCNIDFQLVGEFNVKKEISYEPITVGALFG